jgi:putative aldouronate transport system substrate-binding protein
MKSKISLLLALLILIGLAACASDNTPEPSSTATATPTPQASGEPEPEETDSPRAGLPITDERTDIDVWATWGGSGISMYLTDWNDAVGFKAVEEKTNIHVNWTIASEGSEQEAFNLLMVSDVYPDIIMGFTTYYTGGLDHALENDIIIELEDVINTYMPNYWSRISVNEERVKNVKTDSGKFLAIYKVMSEKQAPWGGQTIRKDWLDDLGMGIPETYDELYDVLVAFRDVKGAGKPMKLGNNGDTFGYAMAGGFGTAATMVQKDGKVYYGPMLPEYKQYLELTKKWYDEGLIDRDFASSSPFDFADWYNENTGYSFGFATVGTYEEVGGQSTNPNYLTIGVKNPVMNKGDASRFGILARDIESGHVISSQCDQIEICARWIDYLYSDEGAVLVNFGKENETFFFDEEGHPTLDAEALEDMYGAPFSSLQMVTGPVDMSYYSIKYNGYGLKKASMGMNYSYMEAGQAWLENDASALIPPFVTLTADETYEYNAIFTDAETLVQETTVKIITGAEPMEAYDRMLDTLRDMGIDKCVEIQQSALDRYNSR